MSRLVFITGASSGIGQALALRYARAGWRLALVARRVVALQEWAHAHGLESDRCLVRAADVRDALQLRQAAQACIAQWGVPDVVIANAGVSVGIDLHHEEDLDVLKDLIDTNLMGLAATFQPFIAPMKQRGSGTLVGVASVASVRGLPGHAGYCAAKGAVVQLCETLRGELKPYGVAVVTLAPGYIDTPLTRGNDYPMPFLMEPETFADKAFAAIEARVRWRVIPWQMGVVATVMKFMPRWLFDAVVGAQRHRKKRRRQS
ncbi:MAG: SDR family oxidoreductase [Burkholderiales bacterium]|nr:SDR family oxidoreductase [Burkholderiales bacterium]MDE2076389.1 SDR family oxidoreductase [Burkholderiales bacterium]MDE2432705.1 SDR family oxidoreductase [Burkholderiales bacterium]